MVARITACLAIPVAQSLALITALRVFFHADQDRVLGLGSARLVDLLVATCLLWLLARIPTWAARMVFVGRPGTAMTVAKSYVAYWLVPRPAPAPAMTPTRVDPDGGVVRIPADLDRPDRILGGLTARQLAILAGGVAAWTLMGRLEPLAGLPAAAATPCWRAGDDGDGAGLARWVAAGSPRAVAGLGWWRQPRRLVVALDGILPAPAWAGRQVRRWRRSRSPSGAWIPPGWWI